MLELCYSMSEAPENRKNEEPAKKKVSRVSTDATHDTCPPRKRAHFPSLILRRKLCGKLPCESMPRLSSYGESNESP